MSQDFDIAIIGAGIAGASTAWALLEAAPQLRVALIEMEQRPGYHTTGRSAAIFIESYGGPAVVPATRGTALSPEELPKLREAEAKSERTQR